MACAGRRLRHLPEPAEEAQYLLPIERPPAPATSGGSGIYGCLLVATLLADAGDAGGACLGLIPVPLGFGTALGRCRASRLSIARGFVPTSGFIRTIRLIRACTFLGGARLRFAAYGLLRLARRTSGRCRPDRMASSRFGRATGTPPGKSSRVQPTRSDHSGQQIFYHYLPPFMSLLSGPTTFRIVG